MPVLTILYPSSEGGRFDVDYYTGSHIPLVRQHWEKHGLSDVQVLRGVPGPDGSAPGYHLIALLSFASADGLKAAGKESGKALFADVANFTDAKPVMQLTEAVG